MLSLVVCHAQTSAPAKKSSHSTAKHAVHHTRKSSRKATRKVDSTTKKKTGKSRGRKHKRIAGWRHHGQQKIDSQRAQAIQEALIREHYLDGTPSGTWDSATQKAMQKFQADNGWQTTTTPDSRALIKLGLGPDHAHLLNPESAMTSSPDPPRPTGETEKPVASSVATPAARKPDTAGAAAGDSNPTN